MVSSMGKSTLHFISVSTHKMHRDDIEKRTSSKRYSPKSLQIGEIHHRCVQKGHIAEVKRFQLCQICILNPIPRILTRNRLQITVNEAPQSTREISERLKGFECKQATIRTFEKQLRRSAEGMIATPNRCEFGKI